MEDENGEEKENEQEETNENGDDDTAANERHRSAIPEQFSKKALPANSRKMRMEFVIAKPDGAKVNFPLF